MRISPVNNINFRKLYIQEGDYSSAQSQYLSVINSKLNDKYGDQSYSEKLEKLGYDIWVKPDSKDSIRLILSKRDKKGAEPYRANSVALIGNYHADFNPQTAIDIAKDNNKLDSILNKTLLGIAGLFTVFAIFKGCNDKSSVKKLSDAAINNIENITKITK